MAAPSPKQRAVTMKRNGMDDSLVGAILGLEAADVRSLMYDAAPQVVIGGPLVVKSATTVVDHAHLLDVHETPVVVAEAAEGSFLIPVHAVLIADLSVGYDADPADVLGIVSSDFGFPTFEQLGPSGGPYEIVGNFLQADGGPYWVHMDPYRLAGVSGFRERVQQSYSGETGESVWQLRLESDDGLGGGAAGNTVTVTVYYAEQPR